MPSFFGIGAYIVTLALVYWNLTPWLGIPLGMVVGAMAAVLIGLPTFRLRGHYFALSMLAYPLAILYVLEYLGFQEVSLPMHRDHPALFLQFNNPLLSTLVAVGLFVAAHDRRDAGGEFALRPRPARDPAERAGGGGGRASTPGDGRCAGWSRAARSPPRPAGCMPACCWW